MLHSKGYLFVPKRLLGGKHMDARRLTLVMKVMTTVVVVVVTSFTCWEVKYSSINNNAMKALTLL